MNILLTNDDGILAGGLLALANRVKDLGTLSIVAPQTMQSATGHSITLTEPLICSKIELPGGLPGYSIAGRPADCVKLAMVEILPRILPPPGRPDLILSGINAGANIGINVLYSGTVAAAIEGAFFNIPAVAFSLAIRDKVDFEYAARMARMVLDLLIRKKVLNDGAVINVNIPPVECGEPKGIRVVQQSTQCGQTVFDRRHDPRGRLYFWLTGEVGQIQDENETDAAAIDECYIAVTPLKYDLTDHSQIKKLKGLLEE